MSLYASIRCCTATCSGQGRFWELFQGFQFRGNLWEVTSLNYIVFHSRKLQSKSGFPRMLLRLFFKEDLILSFLLRARAFTTLQYYIRRYLVFSTLLKLQFPDTLIKINADSQHQHYLLQIKTKHTSPLTFYFNHNNSKQKFDPALISKRITKLWVKLLFPLNWNFVFQRATIALWTPTKVCSCQSPDVKLSPFEVVTKNKTTTK